MYKIIIIGPGNRDKFPKHYQVVNTTSRGGWSKGLSPFFLGPVRLYDGYVAQNVENGWQYSKVYPNNVDPKGNPDKSYFDWAEEGWNNKRAVRYPMGKGAKPLYSYWNGEKLGYIEARKKIYIPLYAKAVVRSHAFSTLKAMHEKGPIVLWDFDGYRYDSMSFFPKLDMNLHDVINNPSRIMGHAFVLKMLLMGWRCKFNN